MRETVVTLKIEIFFKAWRGEKEKTTKIRDIESKEFINSHILDKLVH